MDELHIKIAFCNKCNLCSHKKGYKNTVRRGTDEAPILIIGEAPGQQEEHSGIPFVGESGAMLQNILESVQIQNEVYITNIVKCRPPDNRKPESEEIKACVEWTHLQIKQLKPKILVLAGKTAYTGLIGNKWVDGSAYGITKHRGIWFKYQEIDTISVFHPSYLLRNPKLDMGSPKYLTWKDFISIKEKLQCL